MYRKFLTAAALAAAVCTTSCQKEKDVTVDLNGYFYTPGAETKSEELQLFMDGAYKGILPAIGPETLAPMSPADPLLQEKALHFSFPSGKHVFEARTASGDVAASAEVTFRFTDKGSQGGSTSSRIGGCGDQMQGKDVALYLHR